jgi:hypothetical protein
MQEPADFNTLFKFVYKTEFLKSIAYDGFKVKFNFQYLVEHIIIGALLERCSVWLSVG